MPEKPGSPPGAPQNQGQSTAEGEEVGASETVAGVGDGEMGEGVGDVEDGAEGGSTDGGSAGSQGAEEDEEDTQGEFIQEEEVGAEQTEGETGSVEEIRPNGDGTDPGEEVGEGEEGSNYLVAAGSAYPCPSPGYFSLTGSCTEFWVCKEVGVYKIVDFQSQPVLKTNI